MKSVGGRVIAAVGGGGVVNGGGYAEVWTRRVLPSYTLAIDMRVTRAFQLKISRQGGPLGKA